MYDKLQQIRQNKADEDRGFTLIELLVVVVIIGILIAIAIPLYLNYQKGAKDKSAQSDLRAAVSTIQQCYTDNNNAYPPATTGNATTPGVTSTGTGDTVGTDMSNSVTFWCNATSGQTEVANLSSGTHLSYAVASGVVTMKAWNTGGNKSSGTTTGLYYSYTSSAGGSIQ